MAIKFWQQYVVGIVVGFNIFVMAMGTGWSSPSQSKLQDAERSPLGYALSDAEFGSVSSVFLLFSLIGPPITGTLVTVMSCRHILLIALGIQIIGWIFITLALNFVTLILGRILLGLVSTINMSSVFMLINEIITPEARGVVSTFVSLYISIGHLYAYTLGSFSSYYVFNSVNTCIVVVHLVVMFLLPESPVYLMKKGDREGAIKSLRKLHGEKVFDLDLEYPKPKEEDPKKKWINPKVFKDKANLKSVFLASVLIGCQSLIGSTILTFYMHYIFESAGSMFAPAIATIIVALFSVGSSIVSSLITSRTRRKVLLIPAYTIAVITIVTLGIYFKLDNDGWDVSSTVGFLPLIILVTFTVATNVGIGPVTYATIGELTTAETKTAISTLSMATSVITSFILLRLFNVLINALGIHGMFFLCSGFGVCLLLVVIFILPETKGKTADEIRAKLM